MGARCSLRARTWRWQVSNIEGRSIFLTHMEFDLRKTCVVVEISNCPIHSQPFSECNGAVVVFLYEYPKDAVALACKGFARHDGGVRYDLD